MSQRLIISNPRWELSGVNTHSVRLMRNLGARGVECELLITVPGQDLAGDPTVPGDVNIKHLSQAPERGLRERWARFTAYMEARKPCIYLVQYDFECSCTVPVLSNGIGVIDVMQSDEDYYYAHAATFHPYWNAIATVSSHLRDRVQAQFPQVAGRTHFIANGVRPAGERRARPIEPGGPLRLIYSGRIAEHQKRISDLAALAEALAEAGVNYHLTLAGDGPEMPAMAGRLEPLSRRGLVELAGKLPFEEVMARYQASDVLLLTSGWEGLSNTLLEAMNSGCVPVVTDIPSGVPDVVSDGENGLLAPVGDIPAFVAHLRGLASDPVRLERLSAAAWQTIRERFTDTRETDEWEALLERVSGEIRTGAFRRPRGKIIVPQNKRLAYRIRKGIARRLPFAKKGA